jgi:hypothetical protein
MFYAQDLNEHVTQLDIYNKTPAVIYSVPVAHIDKNDVIQITTELEATNNYQYNVMIGCNVILTDNSSSIKGTLIDQKNSFNITPNMHHGTVSKARNWKSLSSYDNKYVNVVCWSMSKNSLNSQSLKIEQGYGHLDLLVTRS